MKWLVLTSLLLTVSCAPTLSECSWSRKMVPDPGFEERWTEHEKRQAVAINRKVEEFCR